MPRVPRKDNFGHFTMISGSELFIQREKHEIWYPNCFSERIIACMNYANVFSKRKIIIGFPEI